MKKPLLFVAAVLATFIGIQNAGAVTFEKTLVVTSKSELGKGIVFPIIGLQDEKPKLLSIRVFKWAQSLDRHIELKPTEDVQVFPQMIRLGPDIRRNIRLKFSEEKLVPKKDGREFEEHYRIVLEEFGSLDESKQDSKEEAKNVVVVRPRVTVPLIVRPDGWGGDAVGQPSIDGFSLEPGSEKMPPFTKVAIRNSSDTVLRVTEYRIASESIATPMLSYVLPGSVFNVILPTHVDASKLEFGYQIFSKNGDPISKVLRNVPMGGSTK